MIPWASKKHSPCLKNDPGHPKNTLPVSKTTVGIQKTLSPSQKQPWASKKADPRLNNDHGNPRGIPHLTKNLTSKKHSPVPKTTLCTQKAILLPTKRPSGLQDRGGAFWMPRERFWNGGYVFWMPMVVFGTGMSFLDAHGRFWTGDVFLGEGGALVPPPRGAHQRQLCTSAKDFVQLF